MILRERSVSDISAISSVHQSAFGRSAEAELVERLRDANLVAASVIADDDGVVIGHVLFSEPSPRLPSQWFQSGSVAGLERHLFALD